ncbi:hypothetical protein BJV77DRAFT_989524 [Russula vinacea]|nr:hypothetical protein BJV77DRAFT_989524 [Russula vinacea]
MYHYALALRRSSLLMVNSSWTKNHVGSILAYSDPLLDLIHFPLTFIGGLFLSLTPNIVHPPCNTHALSHVRPEKCHSAQIRDVLAPNAVSGAQPVYAPITRWRSA